MVDNIEKYVCRDRKAPNREMTRGPIKVIEIVQMVCPWSHRSSR